MCNSSIRTLNRYLKGGKSLFPPLFSKINVASQLKNKQIHDFNYWSTINQIENQYWHPLNQCGQGGSFYRRISICCWALTSFLYKRCLHCTSFLLCRIPTWHPTKVFRSSPFGKGFWTNLVSAGVFQREYQLWHLCLKVIHPKYYKHLKLLSTSLWAD